MLHHTTPLDIGYIQLPHFLRSNIRTYKSSTFFLAQGVLRKKVKLDLMLGLLIKQLMVMRLPRSSQPKCPTNSMSIDSKVLPCNGSLDIVWNCCLCFGKYTPTGVYSLKQICNPNKNGLPFSNPFLLSLTVIRWPISVGRNPLTVIRWP